MPRVAPAMERSGSSGADKSKEAFIFEDLELKSIGGPPRILQFIDIDARCEQLGEACFAQVGWNLDIGTAAKHEARGGNRPAQVFEAGLLLCTHARVVLRAEVLHDHFLHMPMPGMRIAKRDQGLDPFQARFADANEDPARIGNARAPRRLDRSEAHRGHLVGAAVMRTARRTQAGRRWSLAGVRAVAAVRTWGTRDRWAEALARRPLRQRTDQRQAASRCPLVLAPVAMGASHSGERCGTLPESAHTRGGQIGPGRSPLSPDYRSNR